MGKLVKKALNYISSNNDLDFSSFISKAEADGDFDNSSTDEIEKAIIIIMQNTNEDNRRWINRSIILRRYCDLFIKNFSKIQFKNNSDFFYSVIKALQLHNMSYSSFNLLIDEILKCDVILGEKEIGSLLGYALNKKINVSDDIYIKLLNGSNTCNGTIFYIEDCSSENIDLVYDNIDSILEIEDVNLYRLKRMCIKRDDVSSKINDKINADVKKYIINMISDSYCRFTNNYKIKDDSNFNNILEVIYLILEDIAKNENVSLSSLSSISSGAYSFVLSLGDKVIKIGNDRGTMSFNSNPYVNAILLRKTFPINSRFSLFIEVNERLDTKSYVSEEELYQLYKKLRDIGLIWTDASRSNVGRLLKDNVIHWRRDLKPTSKVLGLDEYRGDEVVKKGEIVVLDNDYIFDEKTIPVEMIEMARNNSTFYDRYEEEKNSVNKSR